MIHLNLLFLLYSIYRFLFIFDTVLYQLRKLKRKDQKAPPPPCEFAAPPAAPARAYNKIQYKSQLN